jgi:transcriptional regulator with XRE-family HTH domain
MHSLLSAHKLFILSIRKTIVEANVMDTITAVRNRILQLCGEREISINKLATISALPPSSIKNILYGKSQNPKLVTIKMICDGLGITLGEFFSTPEFDALEQEVK